MPTSKSMQKLKEDDPDRYRELVREQKRRYKERHPDKIREQRKRDKKSRKIRGLPSNDTNSESYKIRRKNNVLKRSEKIKKLFSAFKNEQKCINCDEDEVACLDFHHVNSDERRDVMPSGSLTYKRTVEEINKCVVLCANCHRKLHAGVIADDFLPINMTVDEFKNLPIPPNLIPH